MNGVSIMRGCGVRVMLVAVLVVVGLAGCTGTDNPRSGPSASPSPTFDPATYQPPARPVEELRKLVDYDAAKPLAISTSNRQERHGAVVEEIRFDGGPSGTVQGYLVTPMRPPAGKPAGVVWAHGSGADPQTWLPEAAALAGKGAVSILPSIPFGLTGGDADKDLVRFRETIVAQRRAVDVLVARGADPARLGFAGHSWGATQAGVMSGAEPRLAAVCVAATGDRITRFVVRRGNLVADPRTYLDTVGQLDQVTWVAVPGNRTVLFQFGRNDTLVPTAEADALFAAAVGAKQRKDYLADHNLPGHGPAEVDRTAFFTQLLRLG